MRRFALALAAVALAVPAHASDDARVRAFAYDFLGAYQKQQPPLDSAWAMLGYFTDSLNDALDVAVDAEHASAKITPPGDKPCLMEGDVFFSNYEGITEYRISRVQRVGDKWYVPVAFTYHEAAGEDHQWTDTLVVQDNHWLAVDNVRYAGGYDLKDKLLRHCEY